MKGFNRQLLGQVMDEMARKRGVEGPEAISEHLWQQEQYDVSDESVYEFLQGYDRPQSDFMRAFRDAFGLTDEEEKELAWVYSFHERPPPRES